MPTKALLYAGEVLHLAGHTEPWGICTKGVGFDFAKVMARKDMLIKEFVDFRQQQLANGKFGFVRGFARFVDEHTVEVTPVDEADGAIVGPRTTKRQADRRKRGRTVKQITARNFVIATGSALAPSPLPQLEELNCLNSDSAVKLKRLPKSLIMLGGGAVAVEFAQFFARFGVEVTLVQRSPHILHEFDSDAAEVLEEVFRREGMKVYTGTKLLDAGMSEDRRRTSNIEHPSSSLESKGEAHLAHQESTLRFDAMGAKDKRRTSNFQRPTSNIESKGGAPVARHESSLKEVSFEYEGKVVSVRAEEVFFALGRVPNIAELRLDEIGIKVEFRRIVTNAQMQTSQPHIYAVGDCAGLHEIVHIAVQQGESAAQNIAHPRAMKSMDYRLLTEVVFTEPQVAAVGMSEKRAQVRNIPYLVASYPFNDHGKSLIMEAKDGFVKLLADPMTGEILGGSCVGPAGGELIHEIIAAMHKRMTVEELAAMPHYHPTLAEIWSYPAEELAEQVRRERKG
jgi:pyruvate/2-oxoglutarate dehydrogenase complex dihydrolipoamide dehydrogenase (E3) component